MDEWFRVTAERCHGAIPSSALESARYCVFYSEVPTKRLGWVHAHLLAIDQSELLHRWVTMEGVEKQHFLDIAQHVRGNKPIPSKAVIAYLAKGNNRSKYFELIRTPLFAVAPHKLLTERNVEPIKKLLLSSSLDERTVSVLLRLLRPSIVPNKLVFVLCQVNDLTSMCTLSTISHEMDPASLGVVLLYFRGHGDLACRAALLPLSHLLARRPFLRLLPVMLADMPQRA